MVEKYIQYHHGCRKTQFSTEEMTRVTNEITDQIQLHCYCTECGSAHVLDVSEDSDRSFRKMLRQMFVRQSVITIPDELSDAHRLNTDSLYDFAIRFHEDLQRFPDALVVHRELQDDWEAIVLQSQRSGKAET